MNDRMAMVVSLVNLFNWLVVLGSISSTTDGGGRFLFYNVIFGVIVSLAQVSLRKNVNRRGL